MRARQIGTWASVVLLAGLLAPAAGRAEPPPAPPFGVAEARALLPEAASVHPAVYDEIVKMGALVRMEDIAALGDIPLTLSLVFLDASLCVGNGRAGPPPDITMLPAEPPTPGDLRDAMRVRVQKDGQEQPKYPFDSLLLDEFITEVTCTQSGDKAEGTVSFRVPGMCEGSVEWVALHSEGKWFIYQFRWPKCRVNVERRGERWILTRDGLHPQLRDHLTFAELALQPEDLPVVGTRGELHFYNPFMLGMTARGRLLSDVGVTGLDVLPGILARESLRRMSDPDGSSGRDVVLRVEATTAWELVAWVHQALTEFERPFRRISFAVAPEPGGERAAWEDPEREGILATHVPPLPASGATPPFAGLRVVVRPHASATSRAGCFAAFAAALAKLPEAQRRASIQVPAPGGVETRHVLTVVDMLFRAGAKSVVFEPLPRPIDAVKGVDPGAWKWLWDYADQHPVRETGFQVEVPGVGLVGPAEPPPVARNKDRPGGYVRDAR